MENDSHAKQKLTRLIWIDLEMTGLDTQNDHIIEIATVVTDDNLEIIAKGPELALYQSEEVLQKLDSWNQTTHSQSGLLDRVRQSSIDCMEAERLTLAFLRQHVPFKQSPMCGNSICQDRRFLARLMPNLESYFHYRHLDVSTLKELARRWRPDLYTQLEKKSSHRALDDILESIDELRFYKQHFLSIL